MAAAGPRPQASTSTSGCGTPPSRRPILRLLFHLTAVVVAFYAVGGPSLGLLSFVSGHAALCGVQGDRGQRHWATTMQQARGGKGVLLIKKRPIGFVNKDRRLIMDQNPEPPRLPSQMSRYWIGCKRGDPVSEVYMRFPGKTPWKRVGEVSHEVGNYKEAVRSQWPLLVDNAWLRSKKAQFYLCSQIPIQFAYADENAELIPVTAGPLAEGTRPLVQKGMLNRCGFLPEEADEYWLTKAQLRTKYYQQSKKLFHLKKPMLLRRKLARKILPLGTRWYNPMKWRGNYGWHYPRKKAGPLFVHGTSRFR